ncbi:PAS domain S-box protein [Uliginosibacterium sp. 31-16]|uniref:PAS domain-containing sensor histidine kinase n=1 Tax=Uliginosibacterium sp. 31-16 TaxID=3068315 RepID=UPI00273D854C|nr:PAS domain-containing sensor histidine kinase [Uliginosibacterium sp. 31-16]MDP5241011.1 PAS domain S-box protein [Uliginosibacterium sp. 31-16]
MAERIPHPLISLFPRTGVWFWRLPLLAITALIAIVSFFVWFGLSQERDERRAALVSDSLWMEQNLRYQFESTENQLAQIGNEFGGGGELHSEQAQDKVRALLQGNSGLSALLWLNSEGTMLSTLPASAAPVKLAEDHPIGVLRARTLNRPAYTHPFLQPDGTYAIEVVMPVFGANDFNGYAVGVFSLPRVISSHVPWWFAERYRLSFTDAGGLEIASTTQAGALNDAQAFGVTFERMGGLGIRVNAYRATTRVMPAIVVMVLVGFTLIITWSLWMLRNRVLRLQDTETALRSEHAFRLAMENSTLIGLRARDLQGRITYVNAAFCRMVGWNSDELIGLRPPMPFWPDGESEPARTDRDGLTNTPAVEMRYQRKSGEIFDVLIYEAPLIDADGRHAGWMGSVLDITERKRAEALARDQQEQLEATARLVTMGEMASTLAHELNQPLSAITSYSAGCLNALKAGRYDEKQFTDVLGKINHQGQRAGRIIHRIYGFVRRSESRRERMDVNAAVLEATGLLETETLRRKVRLQIELGMDLPAIMGDRTMIEQVMVNLLRNGMDAMKHTPESQRVLRVTSEAHGDGVRLSVNDHGAGISPEIAGRLFDSFFTTKPEGMGMGLKICRSIAEQHNGRLWFEPGPHGGTTFYLQLPVGEEEVSA